MFSDITAKEFVVFDIETTGLSIQEGAEMIEIAGEKISGNRVIGEFHSLIRPKRPIPAEATAINNITNEMVMERGKPDTIVIPQFLEFIKDSILVGHNILGFDIFFVNAHVRQLKLPAVNNFAIDTLIMSRKLIPGLPNYKLGTVANHFNISYDGAHRALRDVQINRDVFLRLIDIFSAKQR